MDTNVLISSLWQGPPWKVVQLWRDGELQLVVSDAVLREYLEVLARFVSPELLEQWASVLTDPDRVTAVKTVEHLDVIRRDPADNRFLECAVAGHAEVIVSGDRDLLDLTSFRGIPIITPSAFLKARSS